MRSLSSVRLRDQLQGFWIVPGAVAVAYGVLAMVLLEIDRASSNVGPGFGFGGDAAAARGVLSSVAGGVISMTSLTLSLTIVTLQLASSQFTPRALKNLLSDRSTRSWPAPSSGRSRSPCWSCEAFARTTSRTPGSCRH